MLEHEGVALREIHWSEILPWMSLGKSFRLAASLRLVVYGAVALLLTLFGWWIIAGVLSSREGGLNNSWADAFGGSPPWDVLNQSVPDRPAFVIVPSGKPVSGTMNVRSWTPLFGAGPRSAGRCCGFSRSGRAQAGEPMSAQDFIALILSAVWSLAVWAYFGAAISRTAAVELATGERVGWGASLRWARRNGSRISPRQRFRCWAWPWPSCRSSCSACSCGPAFSACWPARFGSWRWRPAS